VIEQRTEKWRGQVEREDKEKRVTQGVFNYYYSFIHMCKHCLDHFSPPAPLPHFLLPPHSLPGRSCSAVISNFVEEKTQA
jgi:hypothetical protein